jgi:hypothetical protein
VDDPYAAGNGSIMRLAPVPMFYVVKSLEAVLWAFYRSTSFREGGPCWPSTWATTLTPPGQSTDRLLGRITGMKGSRSNGEPGSLNGS